VTGKLDWVAAQALFIRTLMRDGEVLVQKMQPPDNPFGFALKFIDVSYLDETYNMELPDGGRIIMSVEIDADGKPVAYWLTTPSSDIMFTRHRERIRTRVTADQIIHAFLVHDDESQVRGVTWFATSMLDAKNLQGYKEGVIASARMASNNIGFLEKTGDDEVELNGPIDAEGNEQAVDIDVKPLSMNELPPGYKFNQFDPKQPTQNHEAFYKSMTRDEAAGLCVPYFDLQGDYAEVNFSSGRLGLNDSRDMWRGLQRFVAAKLCRSVYHAWVTSAVMNGMLSVNRPSLPRSRIRHFADAAGRTSSR
jgi:lambda family phage portal protein